MKKVLIVLFVFAAMRVSGEEITRQVIDGYLNTMELQPREVLKAAYDIDAMFKSGHPDYESELTVLVILKDHPLNIPVLVELSKYVADEPSATGFYLDLILMASKARVASSEFVTLAESEKHFGYETFQRRLIAAALVAARTKNECLEILKAHQRWIYTGT